MTTLNNPSNSAIAQSTMASTDTVSTNDRLGFGLFIALALHAMLILGVGFAQEDLHLAGKTIEITLAQHRSDKAPKDADYIAQSNQEGSGTLDEKKTLSTDRLSAFHDTTIRTTNPIQQLEALIKNSPTKKNIISTTNKSLQPNTTITETKPKPEHEDRKGAEKTQLELTQEIASMKTRLDKHRQKDARKPRIHRLTSVATKSSVDAAYLNSWRNRIEIVGNLYYPEKARQQQVYGQLILLVSLLPDGSILETKIISSSGHRILDDAAIATVKRAAPFAPFPPELLEIADRLEIIRTWEFDRDHQITAQ